MSLLALYWVTERTRDKQMTTTKDILKEAAAQAAQKAQADVPEAGESGLRVTELHVSNFMKINTVDIHLDRNLVQICGKNKEGKTSLGNAMWFLISGARGYNQTKESPCKRGTEQTVLEGRLGDPDQPSDDDLIVRRVMTKTSHELTVRSVDGNTAYKRPQDVLDALSTRSAFDPTRIVTMADAKVMEELLSLTGRSDEIKALEQAYDMTFAKRTAINVEKKKLDGAISELPQETGDVPSRIDVADTLRVMEEMEEKIAQSDQAEEDARVASDAIEQKTLSIGYHRKQIKDHNDKIAALLEQNESLTKEVKEIQSYVLGEDVRGDLKEKARGLRGDIKSAEATNERAANHARREAMLDEAQRKGNESEICTQDLEDIKKQRAVIVADSELPDALEFDFDAGFCRYNGSPFSECSDSEKILLTVPILIAKNHAFKAMWIQRANLLDSESLLAIQDMAYAADLQLVLEIVDESGDVGIVMQDGAVVAIDGKHVEPQTIIASKQAKKGRK